MKRLPSGALQARDGEVITLDIKSTGATTNFGVNYSLGGTGKRIPEGKPFPITLDFSKAKGPSDIPNAKSTVLSLVFSFTSAAGGAYDYTLAGDPDGIKPLKKRAVQAGTLPTENHFIFHIVKQQ